MVPHMYGSGVVAEALGEIFIQTTATCTVDWRTNIDLPQIGHWWHTKRNGCAHVQLTDQQGGHLQLLK